MLSRASNFCPEKKTKSKEAAGGKEWLLKNCIRGLLQDYYKRRYSRYTTAGALFVGIFLETFIKLIRRPIFKLGNTKWINETDSIAEIYTNSQQSSSMMTFFNASLNLDDQQVHKNPKDKCKNGK